MSHDTERMGSYVSVKERLISCDMSCGCHVTHRSELVTVEDTEDFTIEHHVNTEIEVFPMPQLPQLITRDTLSLDQLGLWNPTAC